MEKKTIGGFIAALRKAKGMTQKDLAERLHVSDKTVSRWERDDGAPDLSVIPVIAEIFGVTCDELLRGERRPFYDQADASFEGELTKKGEKQCRRLLAVSLANFKTRTFISMGLSAFGTIAAMAIDLGFLRAVIAFFAGAAFFVVSLTVQAVSVNHAFLSVSDDTLSAGETGTFKRSVIRWAERSFGLTAVLCGFTLLPLTFVNDTYVGLRLDSWLALGAVFGAAAGAAACVVCFFVNASLVRRGVCLLDEKEYARYMHNHRLKRNCAVAMGAAMLLTLVGHTLATTIWGPWSIMEGTTFDDYESFVAYMEQDIPAVYFDESGNVSAEPESEPGARMYYDSEGDGKEMTEEEWEKKYLEKTLTDKNGNVLCTYMDRNKTVCSIRYTEKEGDILPITVCTYEDLEKAEGKAARRHILFGAAYVLELAAALGVYFRKRAR